MIIFTGLIEGGAGSLVAAGTLQVVATIRPAHTKPANREAIRRIAMR